MPTQINGYPEIGLLSNWAGSPSESNPSCSRPDCRSPASGPRNNKIENDKRLTDRIVALHDLHSISPEDLALLQKELGDVKEAKTRLETEILGQKLELERLSNLLVQMGQEKMAMNSANVFLE
ncbi:hypothetical protein L3Y34_010816 [Caenorhabditis briggsae]|uniref:Uncharacterized protein n=1 Tax=Caenorhabditis briggsae TaxID=6238 RepID=A0AAE9CTL8_CAEBR|nr:hypothetical protein L3Y34_010816 [Caenorhabditis briggsae]